MSAAAADLAGTRGFILEQVDKLRSPYARIRYSGCSALSDFFCVNWLARHDALRQEVCSAAQALVDLTAHETETNVIEEAIGALNDGVFLANVEHHVNFDPLVGILNQSNEIVIDYVLPILAWTGKVKYRRVIERFLDDQRQKVRDAAREELSNLDIQINVEAGRHAFDLGLTESQALEYGRAGVPVFQASNVLIGYYVRPQEMGNRGGAAWQTYRTALTRLGLPDFFDIKATR